MTLRVVTPILGGSYKTRHIDDVDIIRAPSVRADLRFWWRALYVQQYRTAADLYAAESALWGGPALHKVTPSRGRSSVEVRIDIADKGTIRNQRVDPERVQLTNRKINGQLRLATPGAYALWPAREPHADRYKPGIEFKLKLIAPKDSEETLRNVLSAWILFGGYGSRTRRGLGSLAVVQGDDAGNWFFEDLTRKGLEDLFGRNIFHDEKAEQAVKPCETPRLNGAMLFIGELEFAKAEEAWCEALGWLRDFRQGTQGKHPSRRWGSGKPGRSNWPEADKIRHLSGQWHPSHTPQHNAKAVFPRAGFGLPIVGRFITAGDPNQFDIRWVSGDKPEQHERLASPVILKALPLAGGGHVPCALWLMRDSPLKARVGLAKPQEDFPDRKVVDPGHAVPFTRMTAPGDKILFRYLTKPTLRQAFFDWLTDTGRAKEIAS